MPTPVSPWISTVVSRSATERSVSKTDCMTALFATTFLKVNRSWLRRMERRLADFSAWNSMARRITSSISGRLEGLDQVVLGAEPHRLDRRLDGPVGGHDDHGQVRVVGLDLAHQRHAVHAGQPPVGQHQVHVLRS